MRINYWIVGWVLIFGCASSVVAKDPAPVPASERSELAASLASLAASAAASRAWLAAHQANLDAPWVGDDRPFQLIRANIDTQFANKQDRHVLVAQSYAVYQQKPKSPEALYRWGYTVYRAATLPRSNPAEWLNDTYGITLAIIKAKNPKTYNYSRLMFLTDAYGYVAPTLQPLGQRLLQRDPNDYDVKYYMTGILNGSKKPAERRLAVVYSQDITKQRPEMPSVYAMAGFVYYTSWINKKNNNDGQKAVADFQRFLELAPETNRWRKEAEGYISKIETGSIPTKQRDSPYCRG